jgi:hypothetical protein
VTIQVTVKLAPTEPAPVHVWRQHDNGARSALGPVAKVLPGDELTLTVWRGTRVLVSEESPDATQA